MTYVIATSRPWHEGMASRLSEATGEEFVLIRKRRELELKNLKRLSPKCIFFPHWSHIIPEEIYSNYECIVFHMTDLPFGRGGSPLQNLIARGIRETKMTALRCVKELDAGPVYMKEPLSLHGSAEEIYIRGGGLVERMIRRIIAENPQPQPQSGKAVCFKRRRPEQSRIEHFETLDQLFDHIRMLDAEGYPRAFLEAGKYRFEFSRAARRDGRIVADVTITETDDVS